MREIQELGLEHVILRYQVGILEEEMATHSSILAWEIPWTEAPGGLQFMGSQESQTRLIY